jgi:hypothetical protein
MGINAGVAGLAIADGVPRDCRRRGSLEAARRDRHAALLTGETIVTKEKDRRDKREEISIPRDHL